MNEKKKDRALEELSAYLDGEAVSPDAVKNRLKSDPEAARLAEELSVISRELGRLPAPDVHPAFRTRVMAHVRETPRESAAQVVSWPWRTFAAMVVLVPVAALFYVMQFAAEEPRPLDGDRALVQYLMNNDEDEILFRLSELYDDEMDAEWSGSFSLDAFESVDDTVWLDVLAMDPAFGEWANGAEFSEGALWDVDALLEDGLREETTI